ncbi:MAG TPA: hypothetical protein VFR03_08265 [Thermoanaerobaculia bacterium]|nr:hypothetical protein [Thermoanaerobaculia bacterium]
MKIQQGELLPPLPGVVEQFLLDRHASGRLRAEGGVDTRSLLLRQLDAARGSVQGSLELIQDRSAVRRLGRLVHTHSPRCKTSKKIIDNMQYSRLRWRLESFAA